MSIVADFFEGVVGDKSQAAKQDQMCYPCKDGYHFLCLNPKDGSCCCGGLPSGQKVLVLPPPSPPPASAPPAGPQPPSGPPAKPQPTGAPQPPDYRSMMSATPGADKYHLGEPLISVEPNDLHARTRITNGLFNMSVHSLLSASMQKQRVIVNPQGVSFDMSTVAGRMAFFQFEFEALAPSVDGMARDQYVKVASLAAIGNNDDEGRIASAVLGEGAKQLNNKNKETK